MQYPKDASQARRIIFTSSYEEKQQGLVDAMLCTWSEIENNYNATYKAIDKLLPEQEIDVANYIIDRRVDRQNRSK